MGGKRASWVIQEHEGERFSDLESAQKEALGLIAADLLAVLDEMIERGALVKRGGMILVCEQELSVDQVL